MLSENELRYTLALQRIPNLGSTSAKKLLVKVGSAEGVFKESKSNLLKIEGIGSLKLKEMNPKIQLDEAEEELHFIQKEKIGVTYFLDKNYPYRLKQCTDAPILLFQRGNIDLKNKKILSIVGTRKATSWGREFCEDLIDQLTPLNPVIVSGFAYGIDICAHKAAIHRNLQTIACLAHGLDQIYPKIHAKYMNPIEANGGFFTDFWSSDQFDRNNFLKRNRIIAGLSEATIVIESAEKGGSLVTADIANSYDREVFAVPGRPGDKLSMGCNNLIKRQQAHILTTAADLLYNLGWKLQQSSKSQLQIQLFEDLTPEEEQIVKLLRDRTVEVLDLLAIECKIPIHKMASLLLQMELKGLIKPLPGKAFQLTV